MGSVRQWHSFIARAGDFAPPPAVNSFLPGINYGVNVYIYILHYMERYISIIMAF